LDHQQTPDEEYRELVRRVAESRPQLTEGQRDELAAIIRASRVRRETGRLLGDGEDAA
jgi:hypothetical protein